MTLDASPRRKRPTPDRRLRRRRPARAPCCTAAGGCSASPRRGAQGRVRAAGRCRWWPTWTSSSTLGRLAGQLAHAVLPRTAGCRGRSDPRTRRHAGGAGAAAARCGARSMPAPAALWRPRWRALRRDARRWRRLPITPGGARRRRAAPAPLRAPHRHASRSCASWHLCRRMPWRPPRERLARGTPVLAADDDVYTNHIHADDLARACVAALHRGLQRIVHASDDTELEMGDFWATSPPGSAASWRPPRHPARAGTQATCADGAQLRERIAGQQRARSATCALRRATRR